MIVVTRPEAQARALADPLRDLGARVVLFPTIEIVPPEDPEPLRAAARRAAEYDWIVFTSVNGVDAFVRALDEVGGPVGGPADGAGGGAAEGGPRARGGTPPGPRICAIGPATGDALREAGLEPRVVPEEFVAEAVVEALDEETDLEGKRVLLPRAAIARAALPDGLRRRGAEVDVVEAYRTEAVSSGAERLRKLLDDDAVDLITFTASSTARNFHRAVGPEVGRAKVAAIGPITAETARSLGYDVVVIAESYTVPGLVEACARYFSTR